MLPISRSFLLTSFVYNANICRSFPFLSTYMCSPLKIKDGKFSVSSNFVVLTTFQTVHV